MRLMAKKGSKSAKGSGKRKKDKKRSVADAMLAADAAALEQVRPWRETGGVRALSWFSEIGDQPQLLSLSAGLLAVGAIRGDRRMAKAGARMIAAHLFATAAKNFVKRRVDRSRPRRVQGESDEDHVPTAGRDESKEMTSFPSGHSAGAIAVAAAFAREYPQHRGAALSAAGLVALAQIPRCAHYPTDVGAGLGIGWTAELLTSTLFPDSSPPPVLIEQQEMQEEQARRALEARID